MDGKATKGQRGAETPPGDLEASCQMSTIAFFMICTFPRKPEEGPLERGEWRRESWNRQWTSENGRKCRSEMGQMK
ncbi:hypothetical protein SK128_021317, partial [Halocaridina rubra]